MKFNLIQTDILKQNELNNNTTKQNESCLLYYNKGVQVATEDQIKQQQHTHTVDFMNIRQFRHSLQIDLWVTNHIMWVDNINNQSYLTLVIANQETAYREFNELIDYLFTNYSVENNSAQDLFLEITTLKDGDVNYLLKTAYGDASINEKDLLFILHRYI